MRELYPRARLAAYSKVEGEWLCSGCASDEYGLRAVWQALHLIDNAPGLTQIPLGSLLRESPLEPCGSCGCLLWETLPDLSGLPE